MPHGEIKRSQPVLQWTEQQRDAISLTGRSLLVSAAAGSGKTSVLAERCAYLVCEAQPRCDVNELLVVTFTEAAALEMRSRIEQTLRRRADAGQSDIARRQLTLMDAANISTLHGFCNRLVRQYFHRLGIDPAFRVLDGEEAVLLRMEVARDLFMERYDRGDADAFHGFLDAFGEGSDEWLMQQVVRTYEMLRSVLNPQAWMDRTLRRATEAAAQPLEESELGREYLLLIQGQLSDLQRDSRTALGAVERLESFPGYITCLRQLLDSAVQWEQTLAHQGYDALVHRVRNWEAPKLSGLPSNFPGKDAAIGLIAPIQRRFKKSPLRECLQFTSREWRQGMSSLQPSMQVFLDLIKEFSLRYRKEKDSARALDFADLERYALLLLREKQGGASEIARLTHRQFHHVLVDEYQDINEVQDEILHLVSRESQAAGDGNLFCVGDVKQSIYGFRLAEPTRFLGRYQRLKQENAAGQVIDLQANFRSRQPLLEVLNGVFERLMTEASVDIEYDQAQRLHAKASFPPAASHSEFSGAPIELHLLPARLESEDSSDEQEDEVDELERSEREALVVALRIKEMMGRCGGSRMQVFDRKLGAMRPLQHRDMVILLRAARYHAAEYSAVLRGQGIAAYNSAGEGYFDAVEVSDVLSLLKLLDNQRQDIPMAAVLRSPLARMPDPTECLARIRLAYRDEKPGVPFHQAVVRYAQEQDDELAAALRGFLLQLSRWRQVAQQRPVAELVWTIYQHTGHLAYCAGLEGGGRRVANLMHLYERARQFRTFTRQGLYRFIRFLESLADEQMDHALTSAVGESEDVVRIMSIHKAKGLEFPVVIVPELGKRINFQSCMGSILADRQAGLGMVAVDQRKRIRYPSLASVLVVNRLRRQTLAEEMRILYVAMTRAKEHLILTGTCKAGSLDGWERTWARHSAALPASTVLGARCILDWVGPVCAMLGREGKWIQPFDHPSEEIRQLIASRESEKRSQKPPGDLIALKPLPAAPTMPDEARRVLEQLEWHYPYAEFCNRPAAQSVTDVVGKPGTCPTANLLLPRLLADDKPQLTPAECGAACHLFLKHLNWQRCSQVQDLQRQLDNLVDRKLIRRPEADAIDLASIEWLANSELGDLLRKSPGTNLWRELPLSWAGATEPAGKGDAHDRTMLCGRIDLLLWDGDGLVLVDFKTEAQHDPAESLLGAQRSQLRLYKRAIESISARQVKRAILVRLSSRDILTV